MTNGEQTCSIFALAVYTYLDPVIFLGARVPHLAFDQLPPISDTDYAKNLTEKAFPVRINMQVRVQRWLTDVSILILSGVPNAVTCSLA